MSSTPFDQLLASEEFKEEAFVAETQAHLSRLLDEKGVSRAELARRLDVSRARVTQIFSDEAHNLTLRLLVRSYLALDEEPVIVSRVEYEWLRHTVESLSPQKEVSGSSADGIAEALIAKLLEANIGDTSNRVERSLKTTSGTRDWASASTNVIPLKRASHG